MFKAQSCRLLILSIPVLAGLLFTAVAFADEGDWLRHLGDGHDAYKAKQYQKAVDAYNKALEYAEEEFSGTDKHAKTLMHLGMAKFKLGKTNKAIRHLEKAHKYMRRSKGKRHPETIALLEVLAGLRVESGRPQYAESIYRKILKYRIKKLGENHERVIKTQGKLAGVLLETGNNDEAVELFAKVLKARREGDAKQSELAGIMEKYAKALRATGKTRKAKKYAERAAEIRATERVQASLNRSNQQASVVTVRPKKKASEYKEPAEFTAFKNHMISNKNYNFSEEYMHRLCKTSSAFQSIEHCIVYWFRSSQRFRGKNYPQATLRLAKYEDPKMAEAARTKLGASASASGEWGYIVAHGSYLYWLNAECSYSKEKWNGLVTDLNKNLGIEGKKVPALNCKCGGGCK